MPKRLRRCALTAGLFWGLSSLAAGQEPAPPATDIPRLPPTVVEGRAAPASEGLPSGSGNALGDPNASAITPTRTEAPIREFGGSVTVIGERQITNSEQPFLRDLLQTVPGLDIAQNGGPGRFASVFLRGQSSRATKVLVDGIPINDPSSPQRTFDFSSLNALEVERVEVLRGPQSSLWGSDAVGGVINIITKKGSGPLRGSLSSMGGAYLTNDNVAQVSAGNSQYYFSFGAENYNTGGFSMANKRYGRFFDIERDPYRQNTLSTRFGWTPTENFDVDVVLRYISGEVALDSFNQAPFDLITDDLLTHSSSEQFYGRVGTRWALFDGIWEHRVAYNRFTVNRDFDDPNSFFPPNFTLFHGTTDKIEYQSNLQLTPNNRLTVGVDYLVEGFDNPPTTEARLTQSDVGIYVEDQISVANRWFTTLAFRHDDYEFAGPANTWRATSILRIDETGSALHGSYGTGFIAPTLSELFAFSPPFLIGNPNLRPEHAHGFEYGWEQSFFNKRLTVDATYFRIDNEDLIQYIFPTYENVAHARSSGVEVITTWQVGPNTALVANYTNTETLDLERDRPLQLRPAHKGSVTFNQSFLNGRANWYVQMAAIGGRFDYFAPTVLQHMPPHTVVNTAFWYDIRPNIRFFARIDNLFDANYEEIVGYGTPRFSGYAGLKITMGGASNR